MSALLLWLGTGFGAGTLLTEAVHALLHHKTEVTALLLAVAAWVVDQRRLFVSTGRRVMSAEAKAALKARQAAAGRHETTESQVTA